VGRRGVKSRLGQVLGLCRPVFFVSPKMVLIGEHPKMIMQSETLKNPPPKKKRERNNEKVDSFFFFFD
jgi:hypothetical protein